MAATLTATNLETDQAEAALASQFHATNAMAILPDPARHSYTRCKASLSETGPRPKGLKQDPDTNAPVALKQVQVSSHDAGVKAPRTQQEGTDPITDTAENNTLPRELVVMTTYEQVETDGDVLGDRVISDFNSDNKANVTPGRHFGSKITITSLIFRVYPASKSYQESETELSVKRPVATQTTAIGPARDLQPNAEVSRSLPGNATHPTANSQQLPNSPNRHPHAVALGNGWFVIQL